MKLLFLFISLLLFFIFLSLFLNKQPLFAFSFENATPSKRFKHSKRQQKNVRLQSTERRSDYGGQSSRRSQPGQPGDEQHTAHQSARTQPARGQAGHHKESGQRDVFRTHRQGPASGDRCPGWYNPWCRYLPVVLFY